MSFFRRSPEVYGSRAHLIIALKQPAVIDFRAFGLSKRR